MKCSGERLFEIKDAHYQSWVAKTNENGTNIFIDLVKTKEGVTFDSIIFRGLELPVFIEDKEGTLHLKSIINLDISKIKPDYKVANAPDRLIYTFKGKKHSYLLKNIRRENMKYL
jgi:hypothetical protein